MSESNDTVGPGTLLAERYELIEEIGRGGFGMVFRGRQLNMDREVAIKILPPHFLSIPDVVERFKREARLASRLRHPNTITLHDYGKHENILFIVMELLSGEDLADVLKRDKKLPLKRAVRITRQVLKSLAEAHEQGIVHRDLKPENIFLSEVGDDRDVVKVLDFGIAKLAIPTAADAVDEKNRALTISGSTVGTPTYMSPEQAAGEEVNGQSDLYTMGVILYEMLNGRPPFHNRDPVKVMRAHLFDECPPMREESLQNSVIERVIRKALAKDLEDRFQSANEFLLALAAEPVARPVVQGVDLRRLEEPSAPETPQENEDPVDMRTLQFADRVPREEDVIPFGKPQNHMTPPPMGNVASNPTTSSIIRVIEPVSSEEVILLTAKKPPVVEEPIRESAKESQDQIRRVDTAPHLAMAPGTPQASSVIPQKDEWEWGETVPTGDHPAVTGSFPTTSKYSPSRLIVGALLIIGILLALLFSPLRQFLPF